jgi:hypothetical protein
MGVWLMTEQQTYGFWADLDDIPALSRQSMELDAHELATFWRRSSLSADFWARYTALYVDIPPASGHLRRSHMQDVLNYLLNELFENCAKFSNAPITAIHYNALITAEQFVFQFTNHISPERTQDFIGIINELLTSDPEELYIRKIEEQAESNAKGSGLGYLTLIKDYGVRFGFRFRYLTATSVAVDVQAHLSRQEH